MKIRWDLEEAVALVDLYIKAGKKLAIDKKAIEGLSKILRKRAILKGIAIDDTFRNIAGLSMQIGCVHNVFTQGAEGFRNAGKIFYKAYDLYGNNPSEFALIVSNFYTKYNE